MASPTLDLICCSNKTHVDSERDIQDIYQITAIVSSLFSIAGATFTLLPRNVGGGIFRKRMIEGRQYSIIQMLALTDLLACLGIICLESLLLFKARGIDLGDKTTDRVLCLIFTAWIQYFYITTYFLTASYAIDVYLMLKGITRSAFSTVMRLVCFLCPLVLVTIGFVSLYAKSSKLMCVSEIHSIPLYLASYVPMLAVMVINPVIYYLAINKVIPLLKATRGQYTERERTYLQAVQKKFLRIVAVFFICWWPNIILGAINLYMATHHHQITQTLILKPTLIPEPIQKSNLNGEQYLEIILWFCMGILNPLQAFLNTLVYVGWGGCCNIALFSCCRWQTSPTLAFDDSDTHPEEMQRKSGCTLRSMNVNERTLLINNN